MRDAGFERAWVADSLEITLRSLMHLSEIAVRGGAGVLAPIIRDLADHAVLWVETLDGIRVAPEDMLRLPPDACLLEAAAFAARAAAGLAARLAQPHPGLGPEARRTAVACASDLENHMAWTSTLARQGERRGSGEAMRSLRSRLPTQSEFLRSTARRSHGQPTEIGAAGKEADEGNGRMACSGEGTGAFWRA